MRDTGTPTQKRRPREEAVCLGKEIYQRDILPQVESDHFGEYVAIDVDSGNWVVADREIAAAERLRDVPWRRQRLDGAGRLPGDPQLRSGFHAENRVIQGMVFSSTRAGHAR